MQHTYTQVYTHIHVCMHACSLQVSYSCWLHACASCLGPVCVHMCLYIFLTLSLPNATVVEFTVHCQTRLQSKFKGTVDSCLFLTVIRDANRCSLFQTVMGTYYYRIWRSAQFSVQKWTKEKINVTSLDFAEIKTIKNMSTGMTYRTH